MAKKKRNATVDILELDYNLAELPSSQHRAGLAGLVLMVQWLKRQGAHQGVCDIIRLDELGATVRMNQDGLAALFDEVYAASIEEVEETKPRAKKIPIKEVVRDVEKRGKHESQTFYVYPAYVPKGALLVELDPTTDGDKGMWVKLWRDVMWSIFRGIPATRKPFENRAEKKQTKDTAEAWLVLTEPTDSPVELSSTYFLGAQDVNAENVPFKDRARFQFLLRFWPYIAQIYVPEVQDNKGKMTPAGFAIAIPDIANLEWFCEELPPMLRARGVELAGYRPKASLVDVAIESALDMLKRLHERLALQAGSQATCDLVLGIDVVHVEKQGNVIKTLGVTRLDPEDRMIDDYARIKGSLWHPQFRKQRLINLVNSRAWYTGFNALMCSMPYEQSVGSKAFRHDAREALRQEGTLLREEGQLTMPEDNLAVIDAADLQNTVSVGCEALVYRVVGVYLQRKLKSKYQLEWSAVKDNPRMRSEYEETKEKLARETFLAVRSRSGLDFTDYFASTLCSVAQPLSEQQYVALAQALYEDTEKVRTLTMLALAARS